MSQRDELDLIVEIRASDDQREKPEREAVGELQERYPIVPAETGVEKSS